jgi:hypothetical protein
MNAVEIADGENRALRGRWNVSPAANYVHRSIP